MVRYNQFAKEMAEIPEAHTPILDAASANGGLLWESWINGCNRAMRLRAYAWEKIAPSDCERIAVSVSMILAITAFDCGDKELAGEAEDYVDQAAPGLIPAFVRYLHGRRSGCCGAEICDRSGQSRRPAVLRMQGGPE